MLEKIKRPAWVEINLKDLEYNFNIIREKIGNNVKILAVVKADAYGHGAVVILKRLLEIGNIDMAAVSTIYEGIELRDAGIKIPILLISDITILECEKAIEYELTPMIQNYSLSEKINEVGRKRNKVIKCHIRIDTTHGSPGIEAESFPTFYERVSRLKNIEIQGIFTQLYFAYGDNEETVRAQIEEFKQVLDYLKNINVKIPLIHAASTPALFKYPEVHFDMVRTGAALYGIPFDEKHDKRLKTIISIKSEIISIKELSNGASFGYGEGHIIEEPVQIATIPLGYADCYFLLHLEKGEVLIQGKRFKVIGKVCMDHFQVDISHENNIAIGDEVVILGRQGDQTISITEIMKKADLSISTCETICMTGNRLPKRYI